MRFHPSPEWGRPSTSMPPFLVCRVQRAQGLTRLIPLRRFALRLIFFAQEVQQLGSDFLCMRPWDAVWASFHHNQPRSFDEFGGPESRRRYRDDAIMITMNHERGHIHAGQILAEVFEPGWNTCQTRRG